MADQLENAPDQSENASSISLDKEEPPFSSKGGSGNTKHFYKNSNCWIQSLIVMSCGLTDNEGNPIFGITKSP